MRMRFFGRIETKASGLGPRQIRVIASTGQVDRAGDIVVPRGISSPDIGKIPLSCATMIPVARSAWRQFK